jgi:hypothetical protein
VAIGVFAKVPGSGAVAIGGAANAQGTGAVAIGNGAQATGELSSASGRNALASGSGANAYGIGAQATGDRSFALGSLSTAGAVNALAFGFQAQAAFANAVAIGYAAHATRANQIVLGTTSYTYTMPGLPTPASNAAQSGATYYVTVDANGNLGYVTTPITASAAPASLATSTASLAPTSAAPGVQTTMNQPVTVAMLGKDQAVTEPESTATQAASGQRSAIRSTASAGLGTLAAPPIAAVSDAQFSAISGRVSTLEQRMDQFDLRLTDLAGGIASAMALGSATIVPGKRLSFTVSAATYKGEQGFAGSFTGEIADGIYLSAGVTGNTGDDTVSGRVAATFGL